MTRRHLTGAAVMLLAVLVLLLAPSGQVGSQSVREVVVLNFPAVQTVDGEVSVRGAVRLSESRSIEGIVVPPVKPTETTRLVDAGTLVTDGFPNMVLSLHGVVRGSVAKTGDIGAILIPDEPSIQEAFDEQGMMHFALRTAAVGVSSQTPYFASTQPRYTVGFQSYRVLMYNTTDKTVTVNMFAYLTN